MKILKFLTLFFFALFSTAKAEKFMVKNIFKMSVESTINPATHRYLEQGFERAKKAGDALIIIKLNTPGGLVTTTKDILSLFGKSSSPVIVWITPEGASATSAGALISSGAHFLYMSPGTNIGAATPINMSGDIPGKKTTKKKGEKKDPIEEMTSPQKQGSDLRAKAINDLVALTRSLSEARGRNAEAFEKMISEAKSFTAKEALKKNIIEGIASNSTDILIEIQDKEFELQGDKYKLDVHPKSKTVVIEQNLSDYLLNVFSHPQLAYLFFLIGAALIYFELQAPGGFIAGGIGVLFLILAGMGFQVLPINLGAGGLIIASFILFVLEMYITSYGILSLAGIVALTFGSLLLFDTQDSLVTLDRTFIFSTVAGIGAFILLITYVFLKFRREDSIDFFQPTNEQGVVHKKLSQNQYQIKASGSFWRATSDEELEVGDRVSVIENNAEKLMIKIKKIVEG